MTRPTAHLVALLLCIWSATQAQPYQKGLVFDDEQYNRLPRKAVQDKAGELPNYVSYENRKPPIASQGLFGTCVGFATAYYFRTMVDAIQRNLTDPTTIAQGLYSPSYLYNRIKDPNDYSCQRGSSPLKAFEILKTEGIATLAQLGYPFCKMLPELSIAATSKISDFAVLFETKDTPEKKILAAQKALADGFPIVIGMRCPDSFVDVKNDVWQPTAQEIANADSFDGHAVCVIGYDITKYGGAFRIINSWSTKWGENGLCWMRFNDFGRFVKYGVEGFPLPVVNPAPTQITLSGESSFQLANGGDVPVQRTLVTKGTVVTDDEPNANKMVAYQLSNAYSSGTRFKFKVKINQQAYVYVIGSDLSNSLSKLFPFNESVSPVFASNTQMLLPSPTKSYELDRNVGTDYWLFLYSYKPLNINDIMQQLEQAKGSFADRILTVLDKELVPHSQIRYQNNQVGFELIGSHRGSVVPLLVSLKHN